MRFSRDYMIRVFLQGDRERFITIARILYSLGQKGRLPDDLKLYEEDRRGFVKLALELDRKAKANTKDYSTKTYYIWGRDRRILRRKRPDVYLGENDGINFIEACEFFFEFVHPRRDYNQRKNRVAGYDLIEGRSATEL